MSVVWKYEKNHLMQIRLIALAGMFFFIIFVLILRLFYLQILQGDKFLLLAEKNRLSTRLTLPERGRIYDRRGVILAENKKTFQAVLIKEQSPDYEKVLESFAQLVPLSEEEKERILKEVARKRAFMPVRIKDNLTPKEVVLLQLNAPDLPGIQIEEGLIRSYPQKEAQTHTVGYVSLFSDSDATDKEDPLLNLPGYRIGQTGIEKNQERFLRGKPGSQKTEVNAAGRSVRLLEKVKSTPGEDLTLTIDNRLQKYALDLFQDNAGAAVLMDIKTGDIRALVSAPSFDANLFLAPISSKDWNQLSNNKKTPMQNKAIYGVYSPGSIFKLVVALAGLENKVISAHTTINCGGHIQLGEQKFHCWKREGHGKLTLVEALEHSCDVYFYEVAQKIGAEKILETAQKLGFGQITGLDMDNEKSGLLPSFEWKKQKRKEAWRMGDTLNLSIGQGFLTATPLQIVRAVAAIANGGYLVRPHILEKTSPLSSEPLFNEHNLSVVRQGMFDVVNKEGATAYASRFNVNGMKMAGKTATTQVMRISAEERKKGLKDQKLIPWEHRDHALFSGFAPAESPRYAVVVVVEHGIGGARAAAPIASRLLKKTLELDIEDENSQKMESSK